MDFLLTEEQKMLKAMIQDFATKELEPVAAQIDLPPALINRFDLIFPVRDIPNKEKDDKIATHVLQIQYNLQQKDPELTIDIMKKYVAYARQKIIPKLTPGAIEEIKDFSENERRS